jgi:hypothetical protein
VAPSSPWSRPGPCGWAAASLDLGCGRHVEPGSGCRCGPASSLECEIAFGFTDSKESENQREEAKYSTDDLRPVHQSARERPVHLSLRLDLNQLVLHASNIGSKSDNR